MKNCLVCNYNLPTNFSKCNLGWSLLPPLEIWSCKTDDAVKADKHTLESFSSRFHALVFWVLEKQFKKKNDLAVWLIPVFVHCSASHPSFPFPSRCVQDGCPRGLWHRHGRPWDREGGRRHPVPVQEVPEEEARWEVLVSAALLCHCVWRRQVEATARWRWCDICM